MAIVHQNALLAGLKGSLGNLTIVHRNGKIFARSKPTVKPKKTPRRKAHQSKFGQASKWASDVLHKATELAAIYQEAAKGTSQSAQNLAIGDFMHDPVIEQIDLSGYTGKSGESIRVSAREDAKTAVTVELAGVRVVIRNLAGAVLEEGNAELDGAAWVYATRKEAPSAQIVQVEVTAKDHPRNSTTKTVPHLTNAS